MKTLLMLVAGTITCSTWNDVRRCTGPNGYRSVESTWNGVTRGEDNGSSWRIDHWNGQDTIKVTPKR
jgi:hypothetical protein